MKSLKIFGIAAAMVSSLVFTPAFAQNPAAFKKGGTTQASCNYTGLTLTNGALSIDCADDVNYTGTPTTPPTGGPYTLTVVAAPTGGGAVSSSTGSCTTGPTGSCVGTATIAAGSSVTIAASAATGYTFANWSSGPCAGTATATCTFPMNNNYTFQANFTTGTTTPPVTVPAGCSSLTPTTNHEARTSFGPAGQSSIHYGKAGITYSYPLPMYRIGLIGTTTHPSTPGGIQIEVALSKCPGDMNYYQTAEAKYSLYGALQVACGTVGLPESIGVKWAPSIIPSDTYCIAADAQTTQWYINFRYTQGCEGGQNCPIYYFWQAKN
jgi:hypothetical protein